MSNEHRIDLSDLEQQLDSNSTGLNTVVHKLSQYCCNELRFRKETPEILKFLGQFTNDVILFEEGDDIPAD